MKKQTLIALVALVAVLAFAPVAFAQELADTAVANNPEDIELRISWHLMLVLMGFAGGMLVGLFIGNNRRGNVVRAGMLAALLLLPASANSAYAQEAPSPFDGPPVATQPATPAPPVVTPPVAPPAATNSADGRDLNQEVADLRDGTIKRDNEIAKLKASQKVGYTDGEIWFWSIFALILGFGLGWYYASSRDNSHGHGGHHGGGHTPAPGGHHAEPTTVHATAHTPEPARTIAPAPTVRVTPATVVVPAIPAAGDPDLTALDTFSPDAPAAPAASATGRTTATLLALLLVPTLAFAQANRPDAPIASVSPTVIKTSATTIVTVETSGTCAAPVLKFGPGITAKSVNTTPKGFVMELEVTPIKTEGVTRWGVTCGGVEMLAPADKSLYVLGSNLDNHVDTKLKTAISAALRNVTASDPLARKQIAGLTTKVNGMEANLVKRVDVVAVEVKADVARATAELRQPVNELTQAYNTWAREKVDLSARVAELEVMVIKLRHATEVALEADLAATDKGFLFRSKVHKEGSDERTAIEAVLAELRKKK